MKNNSKRLAVLRILLTVLLAVFLITPNITEAASVTVTQGKTKEYTVYSTGETFQVNLENAYTGTSFQGGPSWITWSGSGSSYTLTAPRNGSGSYREGYVTFRDGDRTWTVKVKQYAAVDLTVSVKFDYNGGSANIGNHTYTVGARYEYLPVGPTPPTGHKFDGWYTAPSGGTRITEYSTVSESYKTLYAQYSLRDYAVSFNSNGGSWVANKTVKYKNYYGDLPFPSRTYYTFQGWYTDPSGGNRITSSSVFNVAADQTLYAHWTRDTVTVTFNSNGGSGNIGNKTYNVGDRYGSLPAGFTPPKGFTFDGWYTAATGGSKMTAESIAYASYSTLYAHYVPNTYKVSYDGQGGSGASPVNVVYGNTYGSAYTSGSLPEPIKGNHTFLGWYTEAEGGSKITSSTKVSIAANQTLYAHWRRNTVSVSFENNGGSGTIGSRSYGIGIAYGTLPAGPTPKKGYSFDGWYTAASGGNKITENTTVSATLTVLYAHYKANTYTVSFNSMSGTSVSNKPVTYDAKYGPLTSPTRKGYTFQGWYTEKEGGSKITAESKVNIAANQTLYARWKANIYPVTFISQGGTSVASKNVTYDSTYGTLTTPAKTGYDFQGWYTAANGGTKITASSTVKITQPLTLYAQWKGKTISVSFNVNGGGGTVPSRSYVVGDKYGSLPTKPTEPSGYSFAGWFTAKTGGTKIATTSAVLYEAKTLYAQYSPKEYTITFDSQCGISVNAKKVPYDSKYGTLSALVRIGYIFDGWYTTAATGGARVTSETIVKTAGNHKLYARWTPKTFTVGFNSQGGSAVNSINVVYNRTYGTLPTPTKAGYDFTGWFTAKTSGDNITSGTKVQITANQTLYAQWTPKTLTVKFAGNGGSSPNPIDVIYSKKYGTLPTSTRTGYSFQGWYTAKEDGTKVTKDSSVTATGNHTLYAHWKANTYLVNFFTDGGTSVENKNVTYDNPYGTLVSPGKDGYTFKGWFTAKTGGTQVKSTTIVKTAKNHTLYARWEGKAVSIEFDVNQGSGTVPNKPCVIGEKYGSLPAGPTAPTGYSFDGWYTAKTGGTKITESTIIAPSHKVLYAHYKVNKYTVTYNTDGGSSVPSVQLTYGSTYGSAYSNKKLPEPTKDYYTFIGWYTQKSGGTEVKDSTTVSVAKNHTLYAHWERDTVTVKFDLNGGVGSIKNQTYNVGDLYGYLPREVGAHAGYTFDGWYTQKTGGNKITEKSVVSAAYTTLYARFKGNTIHVNFDSQGGSNITGIDVTVGDTYKKLLAPTKSGYTFGGWYTKADGGDKITEDTKVTITNPHTFYACWISVNTYNVYYQSNYAGGASPYKTVTVHSGNLYGTLPSAPSRPGFEFAGWYTAPIGGEEITSNTRITKEANHGIYAHWIVTVCFPDTWDNGITVVAHEGDKITIPSAALEALDYANNNIHGWSVYRDAQDPDNGDAYNYTLPTGLSDSTFELYATVSDPIVFSKYVIMVKGMDFLEHIILDYMGEKYDPLKNYELNCKYQAELGTGFLCGQDVGKLSAMKIGDMNFGEVGCGPLACYNALVYKNKGISLADLISHIEANGYMLTAPVLNKVDKEKLTFLKNYITTYGSRLNKNEFSKIQTVLNTIEQNSRWGMNCDKIGTVLSSYGVSYIKYSNSSSYATSVLNAIGKQNKGYLLSSWNGGGVINGAHNIFFTTSKDSSKITVYNRFSNRNSVYELTCDEFKALLEDNNSNLFIVGYELK